MHNEALTFIAKWAPLVQGDFTAIDIGGRETNGNARWPFEPYAHWTVVDAADGPGVDVVADGATWQPWAKVDLVLFAEVAEHAETWRDILVNIAAMLKDGGLCVMTMAGPGREVHGLHHDDPLSPGGWYENIEPDELECQLQVAGFSQWEIDVLGEDVRAWAVK